MVNVRHKYLFGPVTVFEALLANSNIDGEVGPSVETVKKSPNWYLAATLDLRRQCHLRGHLKNCVEEAECLPLCYYCSLLSFSAIQTCYPQQSVFSVVTGSAIYHSSCLVLL